jgi:alpha-beta hydrolase superfamily lysophospholipase
MGKLFLTLIQILLPTYVLICTLLYFFQENLIFFPEKLPDDFRFEFDQTFEEIPIKTHDNKILHSILFKAPSSKGVIFYLHGNAGSLRSWGQVAELYTNLNYDVFMLDYRGYGKSEGRISNQTELFQDIQAAYDLVKSRYGEQEIIVLGYSVGTGMATRLAALNHPQLLILQAPFLSMTDLMRRYMPFLPTFILKYKLENHKYIQACDMPIVIFHGKDDEIIHYDSSTKLARLIETPHTVIFLENQGHNGMTYHPVYLKEIKKILP